MLLRPLSALIIAVWVMLSSCTTTEVTRYERVVGSRVAEAYLQPGADFSRYTRLYAHPLEIYYRDGAGAPSAENLERMRSIFRDAFLAELDGDYEIVTKPAKDALGVRASLVDLQGSLPDDDIPMTGRLRSLVTNGQLTFLMELSDSLSGKVLARAADPDKPDQNQLQDNNSSAEAASNWTQVEAAAKYWASLFRSFLDQNLGKAKAQ